MVFKFWLNWRNYVSFLKIYWTSTIEKKFHAELFCGMRSQISFWLRMPQIRFLFSFKKISTIFVRKKNCLTLCGPTENFTTQLKLSEFRKRMHFFFVQIASKPASVSSFFAMCAGEKPTRMLDFSRISTIFRVSYKTIILDDW